MGSHFLVILREGAPRMETILCRLQIKKEGNERRMLPGGMRTLEIPVSGDGVEKGGWNAENRKGKVWEWKRTAAANSVALMERGYTQLPRVFFSASCVKIHVNYLMSRFTYFQINCSLSWHCFSFCFCWQKLLLIMELFFCKVLYEVLTETLLLLPGTPGGGKAWGQDEISLRTHTKIHFPVRTQSF